MVTIIQNSWIIAIIMLLFVSILMYFDQYLFVILFVIGMIIMFILISGYKVWIKKATL